MEVDAADGFLRGVSDLFTAVCDSAGWRADIYELPTGTPLELLVMEEQKTALIRLF